MGITNDRGRYYWVKRVPKRFQGIVLGADGKPVSQVRVALHTDSETEARRKAAQVEAQRMAEWAALAAGDTAAARVHYEAACQIAAAHGFTYVPMGKLTGGDIDELLSRVMALAGRNPGPESREVARAVLGAVPEVMPTLPEMLTEYCDLTATRHIRKSEMQKRKWRLPRDRAVKHFLEVAAPKGKDGLPVPMRVDEISRSDALKFRDWWSVRVQKGMQAGSANKDFGHLSEMFSTWTELKRVDLANPFTKLRLEGDTEKTVPAFSRNWVANKILEPGALDDLNSEAVDVLLMMVNTGLRPSEITDAPLYDFCTDAEIPFHRVAPNGRQLKVQHTRRDIPLLGVSLDAAKRIVARGGIQKYHDKAGSWSNLVNKYLKNNGLKETPDHTAYSLRHYVENALLAAGVDDRVRADILGHKYKRPSYSDGGYLAGRREALQKIAL
ncbi:DUF6538 domain-containing protein [Paenirhodobacter populi]|uniref:DUF6538 domain-containing protein n=1 Tax=Paenirhodobacter populi TaxID=2306993 RepID=UPI0013E356AA|nr:DUF6538 domain-containing protein [Sinirhodobacter populi]